MKVRALLNEQESIDKSMHAAQTDSDSAVETFSAPYAVMIGGKTFDNTKEWARPSSRSVAIC
jgi:hypothetical protein